MNDRLFILCLAVLVPAYAPAAAGLSPAASDLILVAQADKPMSEGEVRKVDKQAGKITLKHGAIGYLDMPPMTMVFKASEPALLERVKPGDKVRFRAEQSNGTLVVTSIEVVK